jgi:hypothetical protein
MSKPSITMVKMPKVERSEQKSEPEDAEGRAEGGAEAGITRHVQHTFTYKHVCYQAQS